MYLVKDCSSAEALLTSAGLLNIILLPMHIFTEETVKQKPHIPTEYLIHKRE
jgi:hypothetical protein